MNNNSIFYLKENDDNDRCTHFRNSSNKRKELIIDEMKRPHKKINVNDIDTKLSNPCTRKAYNKLKNIF